MTLDEIVNRHGGYWNEIGLMDYLYLVNPYFPTKKMMRDIKRMSQTLITNYPACMSYMCDLASKIYNVDRDHIVVGNGASELIKLVCDNLKGKTGLITPTFNEYTRLVKNKVELRLLNYNVKDIINFFQEIEINNLILVNPQLHTGHYLDKVDIRLLVDWCEAKDINLILDESFIDFADISLSEDLSKIYDYKNLFIIKSLSKSYGMPGLRLGVLASQNKLIDKIRKELPIWNISSFAEYFLEIFPKYKKDFIKSLEKIKKEKDRFEAELRSIPEIRVRTSFANYFLIGIAEIGSINSDEFCKLMLENNILIKDISSRVQEMGSCIRVSVRSKKENKFFIKTLKKIIKEYAR